MWDINTKMQVYVKDSGVPRGFGGFKPPPPEIPKLSQITRSVENK
jgi:hypothetical protein